ncbi:MAG: nucleotidyltransferase family protein [Burkholderiales bacterium]
MHAMILAAGRGERMRPLTDHCPKPLLPAGGKPLIAWHLERLAAGGVRDVVINHAHLGEMIERVVGDGAGWGLRVSYSREEQALETAGGIAMALHSLGAGPFLVINGDVYIEMDYGALIERADASFRIHPERLAHLVLVDNPTHHPRGDFSIAGGLAKDGGPSRLTFGGIGIYRPALFAPIEAGTRARLAPLLVAAMQGNRVSAEHHRDYWLDVGTPERLAELDRRLAHPHRPTGTPAHE